ncbi:hypothetical protein CANCADRAFT_32565 [Tortispora caseinolytica NRRL Y-17796]|uniref:Membrane insertase YidC/Oxa/ALB C-terminal domain-containing protein n=1 Tax=Tortispora caseinolytica NRRL Y-17796 TaxID=767744 RepID=A0A1E4TBV7_9ASCO|nr:hypothetical protein CANCADRAFT_32565 [Tortispora caseinolytica NRRL Y-17796]
MNEIIEAANASSDHIGYLQSVGLANTWWWPPDVMQHVLEMIHVYGHLPWWATIVTAAVGVRLLTLPLTIRAQNNTAKLNKVKPQQDKLAALAFAEQDPQKALQYQMEQSRLLKESGFKMSASLGPMLSAPIGIGMFFALRKMSAVPVAGFEDQGVLWFKCLYEPDPFLGMQLLSTAALLVGFRLGGETGMQNMSGTMKKMMYGLPIVSIFVMMNFDAATVLYISTTSLMSLTTSALLRNATVRKLLRMEPIIKLPPPDPNFKAPSMAERMKKSMADAEKLSRIAKELKESPENQKRATQTHASAVEAVYRRPPQK